MSRNPLIHIGYHKTGSTWLQQELFCWSSPHFAPVTRGQSAKYLGRFFFCDRNNALLSPFADNREFIHDEYDDIVGDWSPGKIPVISNERLTGNPHSGGFDARAIAARIQKSFPRARIFCMVREQKSLILSTYFQYLRIGGTDSLHNYVSRNYDGRRPGFSPENYRFTDLVMDYHGRFGADNVLVLPYEQFQGAPAEFLAELGDFTSCEIDAQSLNFDRIHNKGKKPQVEIKTRLLNLLSSQSSVNSYSPMRVPGGYWLVNGFRRLCSSLVSRQREARYKQRLKTQLAEMLKDTRYEESNRRLSELIGRDLSQYGYH